MSAGSIASRADEIRVDLPGGATMEMVWIQDGTFPMGSPDTEPSRRGDEEPRHEVRITQGFYIGKYEITQAQWEAVTGTRPWAEQIYVLDDPSHPAAYISWEDVQVFIRRLNMAAEAEIYRLPTEAELGVCLPGRYHDAVVVRGRRGSVG